MSDLDARLLDAHARDDVLALVRLYQEAAGQAAGDVAIGFYLTHAYVFALEAGSSEATELRTQLVAMGREAVDD